MGRKLIPRSSLQRNASTPTPRGSPWRKGQSGNPKGRPRGRANRATVEIRKAARALVEDPKYRAALRRRLTAGRAPHMETLLFHYAYGKPKETFDMDLGLKRPEEVFAEIHRRATEKPDAGR